MADQPFAMVEPFTIASQLATARLSKLEKKQENESIVAPVVPHASNHELYLYALVDELT